MWYFVDWQCPMEEPTENGADREKILAGGESGYFGHGDSGIQWCSGDHGFATDWSFWRKNDPGTLYIFWFVFECCLLCSSTFGQLFFQTPTSAESGGESHEAEAEDSRPFHPSGECERSRLRTPECAANPESELAVSCLFFKNWLFIVRICII